MIAPACACRTQTGRAFVRNGQRGPEAAIPRKEGVAMHTDDRSGELRQGECRLQQRGYPGVLRKRVSPGGRGVRCACLRASHRQGQRNKQGRGSIYE